MAEIPTAVKISENLRYLMFTCADSYIIEINLILTVNIISVLLSMLKESTKVVLKHDSHTNQ